MLSNSEPVAAVEGWSEGAGVSSVSTRGTTQREVKAPKFRLKASREFVSSDSRAVGSEAATSQEMRNSLPTEDMSPEN